MQSRKRKATIHFFEHKTKEGHSRHVFRQMKEQMDDDLPLVPVTFADNYVEQMGEIRAEFVLIDEHFERLDSFRNRYSNHAYPREDQQNQLEENLASNACEHPKVDSSKSVGAWAAGIVLGFAMGVGPSLSMAFGIGAAYYSSQKEGVASDIARAFGDVALLSHAKFIQVNEKHKIVNTLADGVAHFSKNCLAYTATCRDKLFRTAKQNPERTP